jgi:regulation of enolase protein 1 (concanavalin A-like superfamily)
MAPFWLRLSRAENTFTASFSPDGQTWTIVGSTNLALKPRLETGLAGCSRIKVSTTVMFDHVSIPGWKP